MPHLIVNSITTATTLFKLCRLATKSIPMGTTWSSTCYYVGELKIELTSRREIWTSLWIPFTKIFLQWQMLITSATDISDLGRFICNSFEINLAFNVLKHEKRLMLTDFDLWNFLLWLIGCWLKLYSIMYILQFLASYKHFCTWKPKPCYLRPSTVL